VLLTVITLPTICGKGLSNRLHSRQIEKKTC